MKDFNVNCQNNQTLINIHISLNFILQNMHALTLTIPLLASALHASAKHIHRIHADLKFISNAI